MKEQIGQRGIGGNRESWYYLEKDEGSGDLFYIHEWDNMSHNLSSKSGSEKVPLSEAEGRPFYDEAIELSKKWET